MLSPNLFFWVDTQAELERVAAELSSAKELAVDTETDNYHAFRARLCLIQIATDKNIFLVDSLSPNIELQTLAPVFENPLVTKYFHSAGADLSYLLSQQLRVRGLFDTQRAALYLQKPKLGLAWLTEHYLDISLNKAQQRANFAKRPLPDNVLHYAASDVRFLLQLGHLLKTECMQKNLLEEVLLDCLRMEAQAHPPANPGEGAAFFQTTSLPAEEKHLLVNIAQRLHTARLKWAKRRKRPFGQILSNHALKIIARKAPTTLKELQQLPDISQGFVTQFGPRVLECIEEAKQTPFVPPKESSPAQKEFERLVRKRIEVLSHFRAQMLEPHALAPSQILTNALIEELAYAPPASAEALLRFPYFGNKRFRLYGDQILELLAPFTPPPRRMR